MPVVVLGVICIIVAALLGGVNMITSPIIEEAKNQAANAALLVVLPDAKDFEEITVTEDFPDGIKKAHKADIGYVFEVDVKGKEAMTVMCGVDNDGKIVKVTVLSEQETPGYKEKVLPFVTGDEGKYNGKASGDLSPEIFSGATLTSNGIYNAVKASLDAFTVIGGGKIDDAPAEETLPKTDGEIIALAAELVGEGAEFTDVTPANTELVKRVYKEKSGAGYVAYTVSISENYGTVDTENLIHIGNNGNIQNIKKLTWAVSPAAPDWGYNPPTEEKMTEFYEGLVGKNSANIGEVDLKTGATNTTTTLVASVTEALGVVDTLIKNDMPTPEDEVKALAAELVGDGAAFTDVTPENTQLVRKIYKENSGLGYVVYTVSISEQYGTVDTENLIYIGNDGAVRNIKKLTWSVSDAVPEWGYNPPTEEKMTEFYEGLVGKNSANIGEVDLKTGATNTTTKLVSSIAEALAAVDKLIAVDMPTPEDEVKALAAELVGEGTTLTDVTPSSASLVKRLYRADGTKGYVAYLVAISPNYGTVETETLLHIDSEGKIVSAKKLTWKVSDAVPEWGYNPPTDEEVDELYDSLVGKDSESIGDVDLKTGVTNTTERLIGSVSAALECVDSIAQPDGGSKADSTARIIGIVGVSVIVLGIAACIAVPKIIRRRKNG